MPSVKSPDRQKKKEPCGSLWRIYEILYSGAAAIGAEVATNHLAALGAEAILQPVIGGGGSRRCLLLIIIAIGIIVISIAITITIAIATCTAIVT